MFLKNSSFQSLREKYQSVPDELTEEDLFHIKCSKNEVCYKYDLSSIDGGKKYQLGSAKALQKSTKTE